MSDQQIEYAAILKRRHQISTCFEWVCRIATGSALLFLAVLLAGVIWQAWGWLDIDFLTGFDSRRPGKAGLLAGLWGTSWLIFFTAIFTVPMGVGAAVYLEEYATDNRLTRLIKLNLSNLAGVPSIVYGMLGVTAFVRMFGMISAADGWTMAVSLGFGTLEIPLPLGRCLLAGSFTLSLLILPVVIIASQEALRAVPPSIRHASYALGATEWQTIRHHVLPAAIPGIATGVILALSRAMGETAPLIVVGAMSYVAFTPGNLDTPLQAVQDPQRVLDAPFDVFTSITIQITNWIEQPKEEFQNLASAGSLVLLILLVVFNATAIVIRNRAQKKISW